MLAFPNCKINLGLNVTQKRGDGYHELATVFYPLSLRDALEVIPGGDTHGIQFTSTGLAIDGDSSNNLCVKAYALLRKDFHGLPSVRMHLHKVIPMGAGLGGGSADGAFALKLLNSFGRLGLSDQQLAAYALELGSDCPFFIDNRPCYATGRGENMEPVAMDLSAYQFLLIHPGIHVSTGWAFAQLHPFKPVKDIRDVIAQPIETWQTDLVNDFEQPVITAYPAIGKMKERLYKAGAIYASMSGSGSSLYGIFAADKIIPSADFSDLSINLIK